MGDCGTDTFYFNIILMKNRLFEYIALVFLVVSFTACQQTDNTLSDQEKEEGWILLFDGESLDGWRDYNGQGVQGPWKVESGLLTGLGQGSDSTGYIVSDGQYENFILTFDWKISEGGNSGIFYHVVERESLKVPYATGPEYQVIDDLGYPRELKELNKVGADYAMHEAVKPSGSVKKAGEWNSSKLVFDNGHVEHWLNGEKILEFEAWSDDWFSRKTDGKNKDYPEYGLARYGHFAIQDHGSPIAYKNIKVKELPRKPKDEEVLFNGKDLTGWDMYGTELWYVENGELVCESGPDKKYGYLGTRKYYNDFDLTVDFNQERDGNSGVFIRSRVRGDDVGIAKLGWQVEVAPPGLWTGGIYESGGGRGWIIKPPAEKDSLLKMGEWNTMRIRAVDDQVTTWLNGEQMIELKDAEIGKGQGRILLQIHSVGKEGGSLKVRWKNLKIKEL